MFTLHNRCQRMFRLIIYNCQYFMATIHNYLFQADVQAGKDKVHSMEKAALQKENELEQCKVCIHKCICSTGVYKLPAYTLTMCCVIFAATALLCVSHQIDCGQRCIIID